MTEALFFAGAGVVSVVLGRQLDDDATSGPLIFLGVCALLFGIWLSGQPEGLPS